MEQKKSGEVLLEWLAIKTIKNSYGDTKYYIATFSDITARKREDEEIRKYAFYDPLTGLCNRRYFMEKIHEELKHSKRDGNKFGLLFVDINKFKDVNDKYGHDFGDSLLVAISESITNSLREVDTLARLGGDEFVVLIPNVNSEYDAAIVKERINSGLSSIKLEVDGDTVSTSESIGVACFPKSGDDVEELIKAADIDIYVEKENKYQKDNNLPS